MADPFKKLASVLDARMAGHAAGAVSGLSCSLGSITAEGLQLDNFKPVIKDYLVADWQIKLYFPAFSLVGTSTCPVDENGVSLPGATTTQLTRYDFLPAVADGVHLDFKSCLTDGDRVLAIPVNGGQEAIIIGKVVS